MSPDKLFDYLDGKLSPAQREEIERQLVTDSQLQRELTIAREIHRSMGDSREVFASAEPMPGRGAILGRRIAIAFAALVFLNVVFGIYAIAFMEKKRRARPAQDQNRRELLQALEKSAASALPTPSLDIDEIKIAAPAGQRDAVVNKVIAAAEKSGGSAAKNLSNESGLLVFAEVPAARENEFRELLKQLGAAPSPANNPGATGNKIIQIRIIENAMP
jgi:anti-sigma factor RsiW